MQLKAKLMNIPNPDLTIGGTIGRWILLGLEQPACTMTYLDEVGLHTFLDSDGEVQSSNQDEWVHVVGGDMEVQGVGRYSVGETFFIPRQTPLVLTIHEPVRTYTAWVDSYATMVDAMKAAGISPRERINLFRVRTKEVPLRRLHPFAGEACVAFVLLEHAMGLRSFTK
jgi:hypothetical protein